MRDRNPPLSAPQGLDWEKMDCLLPAIVQDRSTGEVLMLGYMSREALAKTVETGLATFRSRSKGRLWTKGETSGNLLRVARIAADCDGDSLLILADPQGPACHRGTRSCFDGAEPDGPGWLGLLSRTVAARAAEGDPASYTARLLAEGPAKAAQKVGEEAVEVALAAVTRDEAGLAEETADLLYHLAVLMAARGIGWADVIGMLKARSAA
jgi:phosphoribosyl-AMP cyclohydrolase / phosphoribosyl-ATP pyrophosphohydrolase